MSSNINLAPLLRAVDDQRHNRRMTWKEVSEQTGLERHYLSAVWNGKNRNPSARTVVALLNWLDLETDFLGSLVRELSRD